MEKSFTKYHPNEILAIIKANYRQQQQYDDVVLKNQELTFNTNILEWRDICDLVDTTELWKYLNFYFRLAIDREVWLTQLEPEDEKTLGDLCHFISSHADKDIIQPIKLLGNKCESAAVFKTFSAKLKDRGIDVTELRPSSKLEPLVQKYRSVLIEEINLLHPNVLPPIDYKTNSIYKWGLRLFITFLFVTLFLAYKDTYWAWWTGTVSLTGYIMIWIGAKLNAKQASFNGIDTVADLIRRINATPNCGLAAVGFGE
jgi:hypothetical protein